MMFLLLANLCLFSAVSCSVFLAPSSLNIEPQNENLAEKWRKSGEILDPFIWPYRHFLVDVLQRITREQSTWLSEGCSRDLSHMGSGLENGHLWAYKMIDASSKFSTGFLGTRYTDLGDFDQCLGVQVSEGLTHFSGKYCLYRIHFPLPEYEKHSAANLSLFGTEMDGKWTQSVAQNYKTLYFETINNAICMPSSCSSQEIETIIQKYLFQDPLKIAVWSDCDTNATTSVSYSKHPNYTKISGLILMTWTVLVITASLASWLAPSIFSWTWISRLSILANTQRCFRDEATPSGIKTFSNLSKAAFAILGVFIHVAYLNNFLFNPASNVNMFEWSTTGRGTAAHVFHSNLDIWMSSWFMGRGCVTYYACHVIMSRTGGKMPFGGFLFPRLLRMVSLMTLICLITMASPMMPGSGPVFRHYFERAANDCFQYFWHNILFASNFIQTSHQTHTMSWSIAVEVQLYLSSYLVTYLLYNRPKKGLILTIGVMLGSMIAQAFVMRTKNVGVAANFVAADMRKTRDAMNVLYFSPLAQAPFYYMGILQGYVYANKIVISKATRVTVWAAMLGLCALFKLYFAQNSLHEYNGNIVWFLVMGFGRKTLGCLLMYWLLYPVFAREAGLDSVNGLKFPAYFSRIFASFNVAHFSVLAVMLVSTRRAFENTSFDWAQRMITLLALSLPLGHLVHVLFEAPLNNITDLIFFGRKKTNITDKKR